MTKRKIVTKRAPTRVAVKEKDSLYMMKLLLYIMVGSVWIRFIYDGTTIPIPFGLIVGLAFVTHEHFQIDRKVEIGVLLVASLIGLLTGFGMYIAI